MSTDSTQSRPIILASGSPYRRELLSRLGLVFNTRSPDINEERNPHESARALSLRLAHEKALVVAREHPEAIVIGSDQVLECDGEILGKPGNHANAVAQLQRLSGRAMSFFTAVCVMSDAGENSEIECVTTRVQFRQISTDEIERYLRIEPAYDCAGSCKAEGLGISLCKAITSDDPTAIIGLPLISLREMLAGKGIGCP